MRDGRGNRPAAKDAPLNRNKKVQNSKKGAKKDRKRQRTDNIKNRPRRTKRNGEWDHPFPPHFWNSSRVHDFHHSLRGLGVHQLLFFLPHNSSLWLKKSEGMDFGTFQERWPLPQRLQHLHCYCWVSHFRNILSAHPLAAGRHHGFSALLARSRCSHSNPCVHRIQ